MSLKRLPREQPLLGLRRPLGIGLQTRGLHIQQAGPELPREVCVPALQGIPLAACAFLLTPPDRISEGAQQIVRLHGGLDAPLLSDEARKAISSPVTAPALMIAAEHVRLLRGPHAVQVAMASPVKVEPLQQVVERYDRLVSGADVAGKLLEGATIGRIVAAGARALLRRHAIAFCEGQLARVLPGSARALDLTSAFATVRAEAEKVAGAQESKDRAAEGRRNQALQRLSDAEADVRLAQVLHDLKEGKPVDLETRLLVARHLKKLLRAQQKNDQKKDAPPKEKDGAPAKDEVRARKR
jgi:hypothetical protein